MQCWWIFVAVVNPNIRPGLDLCWPTATPLRESRVWLLLLKGEYSNTLVNPICANLFHRHYSLQTALLLCHRTRGGGYLWLQQRPSVVPVCIGRQQYRHYIAALPTLANPNCAKRFHGHYSGQPALLDRHYEYYGGPHLRMACFSPCAVNCCIERTKTPIHSPFFPTMPWVKW